MGNLNKKTVENLDVRGKKVLVRCDFNVKMENGVITSDKRVVAALPTIKYLIENGAKLILCSHLGRPKGEFNPEFSMKPVAECLSKYLGQEVKLAADVVGESAQALAAELKEGEVMLLENVRFEPGETKNCPELSKKFAALAVLFVSDAFGSVHRAHASTAGVAAYLPSAVGFLIQKELEVMGGALENPVRPLVAVLGGAKVSDKIGVIENLIEKCDTIIIGGGMAYTFFKALGKEVGTSI
ncbi:MAG: phosphoglycerate kinase, partial [Clostridia bacterium]|nr:phosphoglycerate kinase [Clostridia bacterium]